VKIPNRQMISTKILVEYAEKLEKDKVFTLSKSQEPLYIWGAEDISDRSQKTSDVLNTIHNFFERAKNQNFNVVAMVTDSASAQNMITKTILDYLQCDAANLFDIAYAFGYVAQQYENDIHGFGYEMQKKLEKR
ncbi:23516_t:CDS:2, partial [Dentiscutata erythropus]